MCMCVCMCVCVTVSAVERRKMKEGMSGCGNGDRVRGENNEKEKGNVKPTSRDLSGVRPGMAAKDDLSKKP